MKVLVFFACAVAVATCTSILTGKPEGSAKLEGLSGTNVTTVVPPNGLPSSGSPVVRNKRTPFIAGVGGLANVGNFGGRAVARGKRSPRVGLTGRLGPGIHSGGMVNAQTSNAMGGPGM